ncbi:MAG: alpha-glucosidase C-terminal domain-containing protein, partial [Brevefilum sp.]|nr:alpha-glucosidase C-terminal domain-containing protein [Brevefilum sp.]
GVKGAYSDAPLRPQLDLGALKDGGPHPDLAPFIRQLGQIRQHSPALRHGDFTLMHVNHQQLVFRRQTGEETVLVALNSADHPVTLELNLPESGAAFVDVLEPGATFAVDGGKLQLNLPPSWGRILAIRAYLAKAT